VIVHAGLVVAGIVTTLLGPLLPILIARWSSSETQPEQAMPGKHMLPVLAALFFLYVGTETCVGGWAATFAQRFGHVTCFMYTL